MMRAVCIDTIDQLEFTFAVRTHMTPRPPVVTILGHVDHGKTSLLDFIRKSRLAIKEHGGITQRIGAYEVDTGIKEYDISRITFIDTPGHEAFTKLRSRGASCADIAILVVDAKDSLMPQTIESIAHIQSAKIPFVVALNKCDLSEANPVKVERDLLKYNVQTEGQGGKVPAIKISAKTGKGIPDLLETILFIAHEHKLTFEPKAPSQAIIVETLKDKRGVVTSIIMQNGTLKTGDTVFAQSGETIKVKAILNDLGKPVREVMPSTPVQILGFTEIPEVGSLITADKQAVKEVVEKAKGPATPAFNINDILKPKVEEKKLSVIIKADSHGSLEAILGSLSHNPKIEVILSAVADIHRSDVFLAKATGAIIVGFSVSIDQETQQLAHQEKAIIKTYDIIYEMLEELDEVTTLIEEKEAAAKNLKAEAKVLATFTIDGEKVFGLMVTKGKFALGDEIQAMREGNVFGKAKIVTLKQRAKKVQEIKKGEECGMLFSPALDMRVGDIVQCIL